MKKLIFKFKEYDDHILGYGLITPPSEREIIDFILEHVPKKYNYIKHFIHDYFENRCPREYHETNMGATILKIPKGKMTYFMDIYVQKRKRK